MDDLLTPEQAAALAPGERRDRTLRRLSSGAAGKAPGGLLFSQRKAVAAALEALTAICDALNCEPGGEVEAVRRLASERAQMLIECMRAGVHAPTPGDTLTPADFGKGEAGVLRLAALLAEAPEGAVLQWEDGSQCVRIVARSGLHEWTGGTPEGLASCAQREALTVVAWPGGAS